MRDPGLHQDSVRLVDRFREEIEVLRRRDSHDAPNQKTRVAKPSG
jgi:hypothetical protein